MYENMCYFGADLEPSERVVFTICLITPLAANSALLAAFMIHKSMQIKPALIDRLDSLKNSEKKRQALPQKCTSFLDDSLLCNEFEAFSCLKMHILKNF